MNTCSRPRCETPAKTAGLCLAHYSKGRRAGVWGVGEYRRVDRAPTVRHLEKLRALGWTWPMIGEEAGLAMSVAHQVFTGVRKSVSLYAAKAILAIPAVRAESPMRVDPTGTKRRVEALACMGWPSAEVSKRSGFAPHTLMHVLSRGSVTSRVAVRVAAVYDRLSNVPGPSSMAKAKANAKGWAPPAAWDDDTIDDPGAKPQGVRRSA